jgi:hypothetical protein
MRLLLPELLCVDGRAEELRRWRILSTEINRFVAMGLHQKLM